MHLKQRGNNSITLYLLTFSLLALKRFSASELNLAALLWTPLPLEDAGNLATL